jgi:hypothetical protein
MYSCLQKTFISITKLKLLNFNFITYMKDEKIWLNIKHCPTNDMRLHLFTKVLPFP